MKRKTTLFPVLFFILVVATFFSSLFSVLASYISPVNVWWLAFFGLAFPFIYILNLLLFIVCLFRRKKLFFLLLIPLIAGIKISPAVFQLGIYNSKEETALKNKISIFSFNAHLFDYYNWKHNVASRDTILKILMRENADVYNFQEYFTCDEPPLQNQQLISLKTNSPYVNIAQTLVKRGVDHYGIATFSRYPMVNKGVIRFGKINGNICIYSDLLIKEDTIRIYNCHLESIRFKEKDYMFVENLEDVSEEEVIKGSKTIVKRMKRAFLKRTSQVEQIAAHIKACPYPVILCGDFNDTPASFTYHILSENMCDAFRESGSGTGGTYIGPFPSFRIDYILHQPFFHSYNYKRLSEKLSDHHPVRCEIQW